MTSPEAQGDGVPEGGGAGEGSGSSPASMIARFLHQRMERGEGMVILDTLSRREVGGLVREAKRARPAAAATAARVASPPEARTPGDRRGKAPPQSPPESGMTPLRTEASVTGALPSGELVLPPDLAAVREIALGCTRCRLSETRTSVVFSDGVPSPRVLILGEAPGQNEDETGLPFVGAAGRLLDLLLASIGVSRKENAYICNVLKCRPPGNRNPLPDEIACCTPFLKAQLALVAPQVILAVGTFAGQWVTGEERPLGKLRGSVYSYEGIPVVVTYHPAALLRNSGWTRSTWDDLQLLRSVLDGG